MYSVNKEAEALLRHLEYARTSSSAPKGVVAAIERAICFVSPLIDYRVLYVAPASVDVEPSRVPLVTSHCPLCGNHLKAAEAQSQETLAYLHEPTGRLLHWRSQELCDNRRREWTALGRIGAPTITDELISVLIEVLDKVPLTDSTRESTPTASKARAVLAKAQGMTQAASEIASLRAKVREQADRIAALDALLDTAQPTETARNTR
ncbi:hypothetical protein [Pandoraea commovens]|uniref:Uncharacterized protein n=1 Tax=Pandoraea commovens TaxID=2508289 RepID=A0ABY5QI59_9BURK|nr:hypothetical protein [Pandoraea commovens]UVA80492.1 hypothetical protein NTU39_05570 [Pandoraea commovens]